MKKTGLKGGVWPDFRELYQSDLIISPDLNLQKVKIPDEGNHIQILLEEAPYFTLLEDGLNYLTLQKPQRDHSEKEAETATSKVVIQECFGGTDTSILLVGQGYSGRGVFILLTKDTVRKLPPIINTGICWLNKC